MFINRATADQSVVVYTRSPFGGHWRCSGCSRGRSAFGVLVESGCLWWASNWRIHIGLNFRPAQCPVVDAHIVNDPIKTITTAVKAGPLSNIYVYRSIDL